MRAFPNFQKKNMIPKKNMFDDVFEGKNTKFSRYIYTKKSSKINVKTAMFEA